jgi:hypothetical protein
MKVKEILAEEEYKYSGDDEWIPLTNEEANRRFKQFGFTNHGKRITWTENGGEYSYEHACHEAMVNPTFSFSMQGALNERDPESLQAVVDLYKRGEGGQPEQAGYEIANKTALKEDAIQYQKIKDQLPPPPGAEDTKGKPTYAASMGDRIGSMLGSVVKGASDAWDSGVKAFKGALNGPKDTALPTAPSSPSTGGKASVKAIQDRILAKDPNALPKFGADGKMGRETRAAMARLGIKESSELQRIIDIARH